MARTVFWSWQSDRDPRVTRHLMRESLAEALRRLSADVEDAARPELDHDTRGVAGSPDIVATILAKIGDAAVFVADVTPIAVADSGKQVANPNVLIELGYAKKVLGLERIVLVWNTSFTDAKPEDLPFDMRGRRAPISYALAEGADRAALRAAREQLTKEFVDRVGASLARLPAAAVPPPSPTPWHAGDPTNPALWLAPEAMIPVNNRMFGGQRVRVTARPRGFARLIPSSWTPVEGARDDLQTGTSHLYPLGEASSLSWGTTRGGVMVYRTPRNADDSLVESATQWFEATGEVWGFADEFFFERRDGARTLATGYAAARWTHFLDYHARLLQRLGGSAPFEFVLGVTGLEGSQWPPDSTFFDDEPFAALEPDMVHRGVLVDTTSPAIRAAVTAAMNKLAAAYGVSALSEADVEKLARPR